MGSAHALQWLQVKATLAPEAIADGVQIESTENPRNCSEIPLLEFGSLGTPERLAGEAFQNENLLRLKINCSARERVTESF